MPPAAWKIKDSSPRPILFAGFKLAANCTASPTSSLQFATIPGRGGVAQPANRCNQRSAPRGTFRAPQVFMKASKAIRVMLVASGIFLGATGCVVHEQPVYTTAPGPDVAAGGEVVVNEAPPAPPSEVIVASPGPGFVWVGGYWGWAGGGWHWQAGRWARPPHGGAVWVGPRYYVRGGHQVWVHGHWR